MKTFKQFLKEKSDAEEKFEEELFESIKVEKSMLKRKYYSKAAPGDNPNKKGIDKWLLNRKEDYEVIPMIQTVIDHLRKKKVNGFRYRDVNDFQAIVQKVEDAIANKFPGLRKREDVFNRLVDYFSRKG